ncbi:hypothetical protein N9X71_03985 [Paracoccus sp. (in: a-proteobacteria)]|nr:hypothetical protein [Paracoccus sp. (in: a-proteobacteria)]
MSFVETSASCIPWVSDAASLAFRLYCAAIDNRDSMSFRTRVFPPKRPDKSLTSPLDNSSLSVASVVLIRFEAACNAKARA